MKKIKYPVALYLCLIISCCYAQDKEYSMGNPIEFTRTGWNKVLCMKNGNTMLFHFDIEKPIKVMVFDSTHKLLADKECATRLMDVNMLRTAIFKGAFDISGEAVLFIEEEHLSKQRLIRLRFDSKNGKLIEEKVAVESPGLSKQTRFYIMKNKDEDNYSILFSIDQPQFFKCDINVTTYNARHEIVKQIPIDVDRKKYDYIEVVGAESQPNGLLIALDMEKMEVNPTVSKESPQRAIYDHQLGIYYIGKDSTRVNKQTVDLSTDVSPYYSDFTYNPFAKTLNLMLFSYRSLFYKFGIDIRRGEALGNLFFKVDEDNSGIKFNWVNNNFVTASLRQKTDTTKVFYGMPLAMFTNENGLTTMVTEGYEKYGEAETRTRYNWDTYFGNIGITQLDDDGNEIWGTMLAHSEYLKSYRHYYSPREAAKKNQSHNMFDDLPEQITDRQFVSLNSYYYHNSLYLIYNDDNENFKNNGNEKEDTVYTFENTNACYYKMDRKKEITKSYLLGEPARNEYKCSFIEGADFDDKRGVYATLVNYKRNGKTTLRMAWRHLD